MPRNLSITLKAPPESSLKLEGVVGETRVGARQPFSDPGFRVWFGGWGLGFRVVGFGFRVWGLGFKFCRSAPESSFVIVPGSLGREP